VPSLVVVVLEVIAGTSPFQSSLIYSFLILFKL
jgi:hypothetical protein